MASLIIVEPPLFFEGGKSWRVARIAHAMTVLDQRQVVKRACKSRKNRILHSGGLVVRDMAKALIAEIGGDRFWKLWPKSAHIEAVHGAVEAAMADKAIDTLILIDQVANSAVFQRLSGKTRRLAPGEVAMVDEEGVVTMLISRSPG